jgi:large subunit ribosomal protein L30
VPEKAQKTIWIKWIRSGIGFPRRQKEIVHSLGLRRLNHVVERVDTPQIRGVVMKVAHLVAVVSKPQVPAWSSVPEYAVLPRVVSPAEAAGDAAGEVEVVNAVAPTGKAEAEKEETPASEGLEAARKTKTAGKTEAKKKPSKASPKEAKAKKQTSGKTSKSPKAGKK